MPLPYNKWLEIVQGPGTWKIIKALFRDEEEENDSDYWCDFTVVEHGCPKKYKFKVSVRDLHRLPNGKFTIRGSIEELDGHEWESLSNQFIAHYNPEARSGSFKVSKDIDDSH
jgi:hypothetical protein